MANRASGAGALRGRNFQAVLFDLDGTLVDTAPDMVAVLQSLQSDRGIEPVAYDYGRAHVSNGALGLVRMAFPDFDAQVHDKLLCEYVDRYAERVCQDTALFEGLDGLLARLEAGDRPWGVVTNKPAYLTEALLEKLQLSKRLACVVSGDTLPQKKPDPAPLLHACRLAGISPEGTLYIGDASRDIEAGRRAGMPTVACAYGYIVPGDDASRWGADAVAANPAELADIVLEAVELT